MILVPSRGCVYTFGDGGQSSIELSPELRGTGDSPILIQGLRVDDRDIVLPVVTLENRRIMYAFGADFGDISVVGNVLLGNSDAEGSMGKVVDYFKNNRATKSLGPISASPPGSIAYKFFLTGLAVGEADSEFNIQPFVLVGKIAQPAE